MKELSAEANKGLTEYLEGFGFSQKDSAWVLRKKDFLLIIDLQRSQWSAIYYVNVGIQFEDLDVRLPKSWKSGNSFRILRDDREKDRDSFELENDIPLMRKMLKEQVIDVFSACETKDQLKEVILHNSERYKNSFLVAGMDALGIPHEPIVQSSEKPSIIIQRYYPPSSKI